MDTAAITPRARTVLIVDDEADIREMLAEFLHSAGFAVAVAENGEQALLVLAGKPTDAIVLDLMMPVMDGLTFRRHQRSDPQLALIPVILVTAAALPRSDIESEEVMQKPIEIHALLARLRELCGGP
jgi:CheY-like chemotaxis protein